MTRLEFTKHRKLPQPHWLARLPPGTSIHGAISLYHVLWQQSSRKLTLQMVYGAPKAEPSTFELHAKTLSETIFPRLTPRQILEDHTVFGFFSRLLDPHVATEWAEKLIAGTNPGAAVSYIVRHGQSGRAIKRECWYCAICVAEDERDYGLPTWRYLHQIHGIDLCHEHGSPLLSCCLNCGTFCELRTLRLPGDPCCNCGSKSFSQPEQSSIGMRELAKHCGDLVSGKLTSLRPLSWAAHVRGFVASAGGFKSASQILARDMKVAWGKVAPPAWGADTLKRELMLLNGAEHAVPRIAIYGAMARLRSASSMTPSIDPQQQVLEAILARHHLPIGIGQLLLEKKPLVQVAANAQASVPAIRAAIRDLPGDLQGLTTSGVSRRVLPAELTAGRNLDSVEMQKKCRKKMEWALLNWPDATRWMLWKRLPIVMTWLRKNDAIWLESVLPDTILRGSAAFGTGKGPQKS